MMAVTSPWDDDMMAPAFWGFVSFASRHMMAQFTEECGPVNLAAGGIDAMIDKATGQDLREAQRFVDWCVVQFGTPEQVYADE